MADTGPEQGIYALINVQCPRFVLDTKNGVVVAYPYIGSRSQQWNVTSPDGVRWYIQNVASSRYLGLPKDDHVRNLLTLREVDHEFAWHLKRYQGQECQFVPHVPYTRHVIDLHPQDPKPGKTVLYVHEEHQGPNQAWYFSKDLHLETSSVLRNGVTYKILNSQSNTAVTVRDDNGVACFRSDDREGQRFEAIETENGWAFRSVKTQQYLGIPHTIVYPDDGPRLQTVSKAFTWMVVPHHKVRPRFKIWIPFTRKVVDLHCGGNADDTPIHILGTTSVEWIWWKFEEVPAAAVRDSESYEHITGERDDGQGCN